MPVLVQISFGSDEPVQYTKPIFLTSILLVAGKRLAFNGRTVSFGGY